MATKMQEVLLENHELLKEKNELGRQINELRLLLQESITTIAQLQTTQEELQEKLSKTEEALKQKASYYDSASARADQNQKEIEKVHDMLDMLPSPPERTYRKEGWCSDSTRTITERLMGWLLARVKHPSLG